MEHEGVWTIDELSELTVAECQELIREGEIEPWQFGAAVARIHARERAS